MIIGMKNRERERTAADLNQEMSPDSNTDQNHDADFSEVFEESEESIGTSLSDILRQAVTGTGSADRASGRSHNRGSRRDSDHRKKSLIRENVIEREFVKAMHRTGGIAYKFALPEVHGMPDRLVLFPSGISIFVEFITPEKILNPIWTLRRRQLEYLGYPVICIDHLEQIIPAIKTILTWTPGETFPGKGGMKDSRKRRMEEDESSGLYAFSDSEDRERDVLRQAVTQLQRAAYQQLQIQKMEDILIREKRRERERRKDRKPINTDCEFHDWKDNKDICRIHMDMQFCSRDCAFATTGAGSTAPYGTKYMKGRL
jgi:hypothetical protein